jgi:ABC-type lipoprotein export system ATPase subunit
MNEQLINARLEYAQLMNRAHELSATEWTRVATLRALIGDPELLSQLGV